MVFYVEQYGLGLIHHSTSQTLHQFPYDLVWLSPSILLVIGRLILTLKWPSAQSMIGALHKNVPS